ncbi:MAG: hypothetical protein ABSB22_25175 [Thermodesulfobacteriota bacterium]
MGADLAANQSIHLSFHDAIVVSMALQALVVVFSLLPGIMAWRTERRSRPSLVPE